MQGNQNINIYTTSNRELENFLYLHRVRFLYQNKSEDGLTCWTYLVNDRFNEVLEEYKSIYPERFAS